MLTVVNVVIVPIVPIVLIVVTIIFFFYNCGKCGKIGPENKYGILVKKNSRRLPKGYNGTNVTTRRVSDVIPYVLSAIQKKHEERHDLILTAWPHIVGSKLAKFTNPESFIDGILKVRVNNSTLYSLLMQSEKGKLLAMLRSKFPKVQIDGIFFRMG